MMKVRDEVAVRLFGWIMLAACVVLNGCVRPEDSGVQVIVGARLEAGPARSPVEHSVVVVSGGKFQAVGPQASTPVPIGAKMTSGLGMTIEPVPGGEPIEPGRPADLVLKGDTASKVSVRLMRGGAWVQ